MKFNIRILNVIEVQYRMYFQMYIFKNIIEKIDVLSFSLYEEPMIVYFFLKSLNHQKI